MIEKLKISPQFGVFHFPITGHNAASTSGLADTITATTTGSIT